ncbi:MAG: hypothetical protein R3C11_09505 [Planctomycetaceae bacterium]
MSGTDCSTSRLDCRDPKQETKAQRYVNGLTVVDGRTGCGIKLVKLLMQQGQPFLKVLVVTITKGDKEVVKTVSNAKVIVWCPQHSLVPTKSVLARKS